MYNDIVKRRVVERNDKLFYLITALEKGSESIIGGIRATGAEIRKKVDGLKEIQRDVRSSFETSNQK